jgi:hypothetical protein
LRESTEERILDGTVLSSLTIIVAVAGAVLLLLTIAGLTTRRLRANSRFELGSVSQQWLLGHKDEG